MRRSCRIIHILSWLWVAWAGEAFAAPGLPSPPPPPFHDDGALKLPNAVQDNLSFSQDERRLGAILLKGSFGSDDEKIAAFDKATDYIRSLSRGRIYDLFERVVARPDGQSSSELSDLFTNDQGMISVFRLELMQSLMGPVDQHLSETDREGLKTLSTILWKVRKSDLDRRLKAEALSRLREMIDSGKSIQDASADLRGELEVLLREIGDDPSIPNRTRLELAKAFSDLGFSDLVDEHGRVNGPIEALDSLLKRGGPQIEPYRAQLTASLVRLRRAARADSDRVDRLLLQWREVLGEAEEFSKNVAPERKAEYQKLLSEISQVNLSFRPREGSVGTGRADLGSYFSDLSDLRKLVFGSNEVRGAYRETLGKLLTEISEFDPADHQDSVQDRFARMRQAIQGSDMPVHVKTRLRTRLDAASGELQAQLGPVEQVYREVTDVRKAGLEGAVNLGFKAMSDRIRGYRGRLAEFGLPAPLLARFEDLAGQVERHGLGTPSEAMAELDALRGFLREHGPGLKGSALGLEEALAVWKGVDPLTVAAESARKLSALSQRLESLSEGPDEELGPHLKKLRHLVTGASAQVDASLNRLKAARKGLLDSESLHKLLDPEGGHLSVEELKNLQNLDLEEISARLTNSVLQAKGLKNFSKLSPKSKIDLVDRFEPFFKNAVSQIENIADIASKSGQLSFPAKEYKATFEILLRGYFKKMPIARKKAMLAALLELPEGAGFMDQLTVIFQKSGPMFKKLIQVLSKEPSIGKGLQEVAEKLESNNELIPFEEIDRALRALIPELYPARFAWIEREGVAGSMAQFHRAGFIKENGEVVTIGVRVVKPGIDQEVDADSKIIDEVVPEIESHPDVVGTPLAAIGNQIDGLKKSVTVELDSARTYQNQKTGSEVYTREIELKLKNRTVRLSIGVPELLNPESAGSGVHLVTFEDGAVKLKRFFEFDPEGYRAVSEAVAKMWLKEGLFGTGFFHMDFHGGNILVSRLPDGSLRLALLDFGMANRLSPELRGAFLKLSAAASAKDVNKIIAALQHILVEQVPRDSLVKVVTAALKRPGNPVIEIIEGLLKIKIKVPEALADYKRGEWLVGQMLTHSKSQETMDSLLAKAGVEVAATEAKARLKQAGRLELDAVPEKGLPLSNRELAVAAVQGVRGARDRAGGFKPLLSQCLESLAKDLPALSRVLPKK